MLNTAEKRILLGLYVNNPRLDRKTSCTAEQINWLGAHDFSMAVQWRTGDVLQEHSMEGLDSVDECLLQAGMAAAALSHLHGAGLLDYQQHDPLGPMGVAITYKGAEVARMLMTRQGRLDLWYRERKEGIISLAFTALVSASVALFTTWLKLKLSR